VGFFGLLEPTGEDEMPKAECQECRFWRDTDEGMGECRRRAPAAVVEPLPESDGRAIQPHVIWPITNYFDWCGEYVDAEQKS
jgi:hypothetical protein